MDRKDELERLHQHALALGQSIDEIDHDIERATRELAIGGDPGRTIAFLQDRHNAHLGLMYNLGKADARIEDLERQVREEQEQPQEQLAAKEWNEDMPIAPEDHLDWFKQSLAEHPPQVDDLERAEQGKLQEMEHEPAPEDHLDWLSGRR
ncbi:hypothetical protein X747_28940 [Mesorhizobium sp. LNJC384A00]|uniref:hypothetical protein n=1 Tax=Mesorhizobium sp. LNJC384A00 TaxID=1287268 RepID=UPI0003CDFCC7|nr:hypothetical protein [Mesorhizobium sp. LNJC384A00]ESY35278.1 hypothetical protein X747_28940 [Mesorhizobium sp. LNJC384A00]